MSYALLGNDAPHLMPDQVYYITYHIYVVQYGITMYDRLDWRQYIKKKRI